MSKPKMEYSKKIVLCSGIIFLSQIILAGIFSWCSMDTSIFMYTIPTSGGIFGAAIGFYLNKAKIENVCKGKIQFFEYKMSYLDKHPEHKDEIEQDLSVIDNALTSKLDSAIEQAVSEDIDIQ